MKIVGNTSFREEAIKKMSLKEFKETYKGILKGQDLKEVYQDITGLKTSDKEPNDKDNGILG